MPRPRTTSNEEPMPRPRTTSNEEKEAGKKPFRASVECRRSAGEAWADASQETTFLRKTAKLGSSLGGDAAAAAHPRFHWNSLSKHVAQLADWREAPDRLPQITTRNRPNCTQLFVRVLSARAKRKRTLACACACATSSWRAVPFGGLHPHCWCHLSLVVLCCGFFGSQDVVRRGIPPTTHAG
jgi:hypothetical protein